MGVASLVLGIVAILISFTFVLSPIGVIVTIVGFILGIIDIVKKSKRGGKKGISIAGVVICTIFCIVLLVESIIAIGVGVILLEEVGNNSDIYCGTQDNTANKILNIVKDNNNSVNNTIKNNYNTNSVDTNVNINNNKVLGTYSREVFSGHTFSYKTLYDNATFKFNKDSTFECTYVGGNTYKGTYEIYNGLYINTKASKIENDSSIKSAQSLADDIKKVSENMMSGNASSIVNTYLLYLQVTQVVSNGVTTKQEILQPFVIKYDPSTNTGSSVNIYGQTSGTFTLKY